ncbi:MAG TPA: hypothetical protein VF828_01885 [Patescibacteria group bacterium]
MTNLFNRYSLIIVFLIALLSSYRLFLPGYFSMQDDMHVFRLQQFDQCVRDLQIPCRHIADGGFGYGYPLYNYYSPFPYAYAEVFHLLGFSFIDSLKISFITPNFIRAFSMYLLGTALFGPAGGLLSSALYTLAPYMAVNNFVRGALAEHWALSILPLVFWAFYKSKYNLFIKSLAILFLSHNLTTLYVLPSLFLFALVTGKIKPLLKNSFISFLISAFFLLPAFFEKNLVTVNTMTQGYFQYIIHFATLNELFISRFWGYGASLWGPKDDMSFQIGFVHWILPLVIFLYALFNSKLKHRKFILSFFVLGSFAIFLTHNKSTSIWKLLPFMAFYQFPWRFLGLAVFCFAIISGSLTQIKFLKKILYPLILFLVVAVITLNFSYFHEDIRYPYLTDSQKLSPAEIYRQSGAGLKDYWPSGTAEFPTVMAPGEPSAVSGTFENLSFVKKSNLITGQVKVVTPTADLILPVTNFPVWKLTINNNPADFSVDPKYGQIILHLGSGLNTFKLSFTNTPLRTFANLLSLIGLAIYIIKLIREKHL